MPMIKCIDCGKEISTRSQTCPNCGCPTEQTIIARQEEFVNNYAETHVCKECGGNNYFPDEQEDGTMKFVCWDCAAKNIINEVKVPLPEELRTLTIIQPSEQSGMAIANKIKELNAATSNKSKTTQASQATHQPTCPYCGSTKLKKIGIGSRMLSIGTLGLAGSKIGKQWHCKSCNSNF